MKDSLEQFQNNSNVKSEFKDIVSFKMLKSMQSAQYFIVNNAPEKDWHHFALKF